MYYLIWTLFIIILGYFLLEAYKKTYYFSKWGIPQPYELPFVGALHALFWPRRNVNNFVKYIYDTNREAKYIGFHLFTKPNLLIRDLDLVKSVLVKNFEYFADHKTFVNEDADPLFGRNIAFINGDRWREARNVLSPSFTASKLRSMYVLMSNCAQNFTDKFANLYKDVEAINIADVSGRYMNDVIASCAFGIELNSLEDKDNEFYRHATESATIKVYTGNLIFYLAWINYKFLIDIEMVKIRKQRKACCYLLLVEYFKFLYFYGYKCIYSGEISLDAYTNAFRR